VDNDTRIAVDLAKSVFEIGLSLQPGKVARRLRVAREKFLATMAQLPRGTVVMEACGSSHFWARENQKLGHEVVLLPAQHVRPYVLRDKTDRMDVKGLLEASRNESIRPVPIKTPEQQLLASIHRLRSAWMGDRTARLNTLRGLLRERGMFIPVGAEHVVPHVWAAIGDADSEIPDALRLLLAEACQEIRELERRIKDCERQLAALAQ
jgi:transposase